MKLWKTWSLNQKICMPRKSMTRLWDDALASSGVRTSCFGWKMGNTGYSPLNLKNTTKKSTMVRPLPCTNRCVSHLIHIALSHPVLFVGKFVSKNADLMSHVCESEWMLTWCLMCLRVSECCCVNQETCWRREWSKMLSISLLTSQMIEMKTIK